MTEPTTAPPGDIDPDLRRRQQEVQLAVWEERKRAELEVWRADQQALDALEPQTMRQRIAHARAMVESGLIPAGWTGARPGAVLNERQVDKAAAAVVLAVEWGKHLGFEGLAALQHLQVVEGNVGVKPKSARGMILGRGHDLDDHTAYSAHGFPIAHTVTITRKDGKPKSFTFRLEDALQAELVSEILRDPAGEVTGVVARSENGRPLPWEKYTGRMLSWRATSGMVALYATDITGGMDLAPDFEEPPARPSGAGPPPARVAETLARVAPSPPEPDGYDPAADLGVVEQATGLADPPPWWDYAGARERLGVRRRNAVQLAADRVAAWVAAHPEEAAEANLLPPGDVVDAEIEEDQGPAGEPVSASGEGGNAAATQAQPAGPLPVLMLLPAEWEQEFGVRVLDPDGWRDGSRFGPKSWDEPLSRLEFEHRMAASTIDQVAFRDSGGALALPEPGDLEAEHAAAVAAELAEASQEDRPAEPSVADLLNVIDVLAEAKGQTRNQYARRAIALRRRNPEDWTAAELTEFIRSMVPDWDPGTP